MILLDPKQRFFRNSGHSPQPPPKPSRPFPPARSPSSSSLTSSGQTSPQVPPKPRPAPQVPPKPVASTSIPAKPMAPKPHLELPAKPSAPKPQLRTSSSSDPLASETVTPRDWPPRRQSPAPSPPVERSYTPPRRETIPGAWESENDLLMSLETTQPVYSSSSSNELDVAHLGILYLDLLLVAFLGILL